MHNDRSVVLVKFVTDAAGQLSPTHGGHIVPTRETADQAVPVVGLSKMRSTQSGGIAAMQCALWTL